MSGFGFLKKEKWHFFHVRKRTPFFVQLWTQGLTHPRLDLGIDYSCRYVGHMNHDVLLDQASFDRQRLELLSRLDKNPRYLLALLHRYLDFFAENTFPAWKRLRATDAPALSDEKLAAQLEGFAEEMARHDSFILLPLFVESDLSEKIARMLSERFGQKAEHLYEVAMTQVKDSLLVEEKRSALELAVALDEGKTVDEKLARHVERFSWMANQLYTMQFYDSEHYLKEARKLAAHQPGIQLAALEKERREVRSRFRALLDDVSDDPVLSAYLETAQEAIFFRNFRGEKLYQSSYYARPMLSEIAKRVGLTERKVVFLTAFEMMDLLRTGKEADRGLVADRMAGFALLTGVNGGNVVQGEDLARLQACIHLDKPSSDRIQGQKGYSGKARGIVFRVLSLDDLLRVPKGCVLVSPSTTPAYVPALGKVAAIVTDEGGILCHAALISREMKRPSVIGTKNASRLLKDGDVVEVDGDAGTVRKL